MKLTVIVPVYNNRKYLKQCIQSISNQLYKDMEIILVDDGSTDGSGEICDEYEKADSRIRVIHQNNMGCMEARWHGLKSSKGEYIGFVDSDDWIAHDMYQELMSVAEDKKCDIVSMGYTAVFGQTKTEINDNTLYGSYERGVNLDIFLSNMMHDAVKGQRGAQPSLCTKIMKRKLLLGAFERADRKITMGEDAAIFYPCCLDINRIYIIKKYQYFYRIHEESMCRNMNINTICEIQSFYQYMQKRFFKYQSQYHLQKQLKNYVWLLLEQGLQQIFHIRFKRTFLFPYTIIEKGSDIILYGAGEVGQSYYHQIADNHYCNIAAWVDKNTCDGRKIIHPARIVSLDYIKILIAVKNREMADEIMDELASLGIHRERMLWVRPQEIPIV